MGWTKGMLAEKTIKKHVAIIHAYSSMTILQRKIVNALLYEAINDNKALNNNYSTHTEFRIPLSKISKVINYKSNNSKYLKEAIDGLASLTIEWNLLKDKAPTDISFLNLRVIHGAPTFYQDNTFAFSFHKLFMNIMLQPSIYGTVDVDLQSLFESKYSHSLYENCTRFVNMQKGKIIQLETFRKLLGVSNNKYSSTGELMRNAILPSIEEVNDRADFLVDMKNVNVGRKIIGFNLSVNCKIKTIKVQQVDYSSEQEKIINNVKITFGKVNNNTLTHILKTYDTKYIEEKIQYTMSHAKKESTGFYPIPYFISALKYDYKDVAKEINQGNSEITKNQNTSSKWEHELFTLQADLNHWKDRLSYFQASNNVEQIKNINFVIEQCEKKLTHHYLEQREFKERII